MEPMFDAARLSLAEQMNLEIQQAGLEIQQASLEIQQTSLEIQQAGLEIQRASLEIQQAGLAAQQSGNDIAFWIGIAQVSVALTVGLIQAGVVGWGIRYMIRMSERREQQHADRHIETMRALDQQHTATMRALEALIERTAPRQA